MNISHARFSPSGANCSQVQRLALGICNRYINNFIQVVLVKLVVAIIVDNTSCNGYQYRKRNLSFLVNYYSDCSMNNLLGCQQSLPRETNQQNRHEVQARWGWLLKLRSEEAWRTPTRVNYFSSQIYEIFRLLFWWICSGWNFAYLWLIGFRFLRKPPSGNNTRYCLDFSTNTFWRCRIKCNKDFCRFSLP